MAVDRLHRDALAEVLAAFLRGEFSTKEFRKRILQTYRKGSESSPEDFDFYLGLVIHHLLKTPTPITLETWEQWCRFLAFLKTDLDVPQSDAPAPDDDADRPRQIQLARWHTLGLLVALGLSYLTGWWLLAIAWVISFLHFQIHWSKQDAERDKKAKEEGKYEWMKFFPFANEEEWRQHEHLLEQFHLPAYGEVPYGPAASPTLLQRLSRALMLVFFWIFIGSVFGAMYVSSLLIWPFWLILMSLSKH